MTTPFDAYLAQIQADLQGGKATEHTYRSALEALLEALAPHIKVSNIGDGVIGRLSRRRNSIPYNTPCNHR